MCPALAWPPSRELHLLDMANYPSKPPRSLAAIKASVFIMAVLIIIGLVVIAAKLVLDLGAATGGDQAADPVVGPKVVHMAGAGEHVVIVVEDPSGKQFVRILDPATGRVEEVSLNALTP